MPQITIPKEREFIIDYFLELAEITSVDINEECRSWLYGGEIVGSFRNKSKREIIHNICESCNHALDTEIERQEGIDAFGYMIVRCSSCKGLNIIYLDKDIKQFWFGNYEMIERYPDTFSKEQVIKELEKMKKMG